MEGQSGAGSQVTMASDGETSLLIPGVSTGSLAGSLGGPPRSWQHLSETDVVKIQAGYAEYYVLNKEEEKIYTALLTYDERSCWYGWLCCCKADYGYIPHKALYPNAPEVNYTRHPLNICGFGVQVYDTDAFDAIRFHRAPHDVKNLNVDEVMKISGPKGGLMGTITVPREKGGDIYDVKDAEGTILFEVPPRVTDAERRHVFEVVKLHKSGERTPGARITIEGKYELKLSMTNIERIPAGDFHIHYEPTLHPSEKALLLAAAFFIRIREFSAYIPMVEAMIAASALVKEAK